MKPLRALLGGMFFLALFVVMLGAYTRLTDAGLGCPDWPGCYGKMVLPESAGERASLQLSYPNQPIEAPKAWTEMAHRYVAGTLGLLILISGGLSFRLSRRHQMAHLPLSLSLIGLVVFQALLGMWTVTLKLLPIVVMSHLFGGILIFSLIARWNAELKFQDCLAFTLVAKDERQRRLVWFAIAVVMIQILLGGWVSANYAGLGCIGFPMCNGLWWPHLNFSEGFFLFSPVGLNYQGGVLMSEARMTIQWAHRLWGILTLLTLLWTTHRLLRAYHLRWIRRLAIALATLVVVQFTLGIINVVYLLPLPIAVAHNGCAALLLGGLLSLDALLKKGGTCRKA